MALDYDTQIELLFPAALYQDPVLAPVLEQVGITLEAAGNKVLLFTNPRTVAALNAASETIKAAMRQSRIGLVCYGGNLSGGKTAFLKGALHEIVQKYGSSAEPLRYAVINLHRFVHDGTMGLLDPNPFAGTPYPPPAEPFDVAQALAAMASQRNDPKSPEQPNAGPPAPAARPSFGKRLAGSGQSGDLSQRAEQLTAQFPGSIQAALLFDAAQPLDLDALVREFVAAEEGTGTHYKVVSDTKPGVFYRLFGSNHVMITVEHVDRQAKLSLFEAALSSPFTNMGTPDAQERLARHKSYVLVETHHGAIPPTTEALRLLEKLEVPMPGHSLAEFRLRMNLCGKLSTMAHRMGNATLVHWTPNDHLMRGDMFARLAAEPAPSLLHIHPILFDGGESADGRPQVEIRTIGARHFIGREIHIAATPVPWADVLDGIFAFVKVGCLERGYVVPDGDTFGMDNGACSYRVRHIEKGEKSGNFEGPLYRLDLLLSQEHDFKASDFFEPVRTFTDRNVPKDIMAHLGARAGAVVREWRAKRQMAEAAGNQFQVRTDRPAPPPESGPG